jgi:hypothetical protein
MHGATPPLLQYVFVAWCLVKHRDSLPLSYTKKVGGGIAQWYNAGLRAG